MSHVSDYFRDVVKVAQSIDQNEVEKMISILLELREQGGRVFILGVGGSAGNAGHAVNDFRKIMGIETYAPTDNVSELTARTNDEGFHTVFSEFLRTSKANRKDGLLILSVGGGSKEKNISTNLVEAIDVAKEIGMRILGIVGRDGGYTKKKGDAVVVIPTVDSNKVTPLSESFQAVVWHLFASDPRMMKISNKWESTK